MNTEEKLRLIDKNNKTIEQAKKKTISVLKDSQELKREDIREHRAISKNEERQERMWRLEKNKILSDEQVVYLSERKSSVNNYVPRKDQTEDLLKAMEEDDI